MKFNNPCRPGHLSLMASIQTDATRYLQHVSSSCRGFPCIALLITLLILSKCHLPFILVMEKGSGAHNPLTTLSDQSSHQIRKNTASFACSQQCFAPAVSVCTDTRGAVQQHYFSTLIKFKPSKEENASMKIFKIQDRHAQNSNNVLCYLASLLLWRQQQTSSYFFKLVLKKRTKPHIVFITLNLKCASERFLSGHCSPNTLFYRSIQIRFKSSYSLASMCKTEWRD